MKTVTTREFYHKPSLVDQLRGNDTLMVTSRGKPKFKVIKVASKKPIYSREMMEMSSASALKPMSSAEFLKEDRS